MITFLQVWEESDINRGLRQDGCSIHPTKESLDNYVNRIYKSRNKKVPNTYTKIVGEPSRVIISDELIDALYRNGNVLRLESYELNNLLNLGKIILYA